MNPFVKFAEAVKAVFPEETRFSLTVVPATPPPGSVLSLPICCSRR